MNGEVRLHIMLGTDQVRGERAASPGGGEVSRGAGERTHG